MPVPLRPPAGISSGMRFVYQFTCLRQRWYVPSIRYYGFAHFDAVTPIVLLVSLAEKPRVGGGRGKSVRSLIAPSCRFLPNVRGTPCKLTKRQLTWSSGGLVVAGMVGVTGG